MDYTGTSTSNKMEHSDSQGSNDTIKITPQFAPHFKPKVSQKDFPAKCMCVRVNTSTNYLLVSAKRLINSVTVKLFFQGDPLRTLPLSRGGSVESLPARTQCPTSSDSKRMSADLSELEPKVPFAPAGNTRYYTAQSENKRKSEETLINAYWHETIFLFKKKECKEKACSLTVKANP